MEWWKTTIIFSKHLFLCHNRKMIPKKTLLLAAIAAASLTSMPAQAFFCSSLFSKSKRPQVPQFSPVYPYYYPQQHFIRPFGYQTLYVPRFVPNDSRY